MKTTPPFLLAAVVTLSASLAMAQDDQKPTPPIPPPPPAPDAATRPPEPNPQTQPPPGTPGRDGRHHPDHHEGGLRPPEEGRPDGWHRPLGWPLPQAPIPSKPTPYIGVITVPPPAVLSAQLGLADGFGLVVGDVLPDSPAAKAGVQRYDVLTKFNDQQLVDSGQFSTLVRALKKGAEASLTFIRKAQEQKATVTIDERPLPERRPFPSPGGYPSGDSRRMRGDSEGGSPEMENAKRMPERGRDYGDRMREYQERMRTWQRNPSVEMPQPPAADAASGILPEDILREVRPGGVAQIRLLKPDGAVTYNMANARLVMKDDTGEIELTTHDGKRSLVARNAQGETIFDGPIDTDEQRKTLPEDVRKKIEMIEVQPKLAQTPQPPQPGTVAPPDVQ